MASKVHIVFPLTRTEQQAMTEILYKDESFRIIGACMEVYNEMGCGFLEAVYQECLELELTDRTIPFVAQAQLQLRFKERQLKSIYTSDFICYNKIIVEIKGTADLNDVFRAQMINYLKGGAAWGHTFLGKIHIFGKIFR